MKVSGIYIYPVKSCKGITLQSSDVSNLGLENDRRWLIVDRDMKFITQRQFPKMALIEPMIRNKNLFLNAPGIQEIEVPSYKKYVNVKVWNDECLAYDQGKKVSQWLSTFLEQECSLVEISTCDKRSSRDRKSRIAFSDGYPLLIISEASLDDLNNRLKEPLPMNRFRPNIVIADCKPYEEDTLQQVKINDVILTGATECTRCSITTVNQLKGETDGKEPLATLAKYRKTHNGVIFGKNFNHQNLGTVSVGDEVKVI